MVTLPLFRVFLPRLPSCNAIFQGSPVAMPFLSFLFYLIMPEEVSATLSKGAFSPVLFFPRFFYLAINSLLLPVLKVAPFRTLSKI